MKPSVPSVPSVPPVPAVPSKWRQYLRAWLRPVYAIRTERIVPLGADRGVCRYGRHHVTTWKCRWLPQWSVNHHRVESVSDWSMFWDPATRQRVQRQLNRAARTGDLTKLRYWWQREHQRGLLAAPPSDTELQRLITLVTAP